MFLRLRTQFRLTPATYLFAGVLFFFWVVSVIAAKIPLTNEISFGTGLTYTFGFVPSLAFRGFFWQFFSYAFLHDSFLHLFVNVFVLILTGRLVELKLGTLRFLSILFVSIFSAAFFWWLSLLFDLRLNSFGICIGFSGAIAGILGFCSVCFSHERILLLIAGIPIPSRGWVVMPFYLMILICEVVWFSNLIAYGAHFGGFFAGLLFGLFFTGRNRKKAV